MQLPGKLSSSAAPADDKMSNLSDYERQRLENIAENRAKLIAMGIDADATALRTAAATRRQPVKGSDVNRKKKADAVPARSKSLRQRNLDPAGNAIPDKPIVPESAPVQRQARKPSVPLDAAKISTGAVSAEEAASFLARLGEPDKTSAPPSKKAKRGKASAEPESHASATPLDLSSLSVAEDDIAKLVPERIFSLEMHPSPAKLLVAAGDTWGRVGLWDVNAGDDTPVATFAPHSRPVAGIRIAPHLPHLLLSCSHDGAVRCLDLGAGGSSSSFFEVYRAAEDNDGEYPMLHGLSRTAGEGGVLALCRSDGVALFLDPRTPSASQPRQARLHEKKIFSVDFSPTKPQLLATASLDRTVALWDIRTLGEKRAKPLVTLEHGLSVTAARFSPSGERLLTTCNDDLLRVFDSDGKSDKSWSLRTAVKHNNKTGRYITSFQAEWLRGSNSTLICGSLAQPRGVDVYNADDGSMSQRLEPDTVTSVVSLFAQHPTQPVLVAGNSGGKCYLWR